MHVVVGSSSSSNTSSHRNAHHPPHGPRGSPTPLASPAPAGADRLGGSWGPTHHWHLDDDLDDDSNGMLSSSRGHVSPSSIFSTHLPETGCCHLSELGLLIFMALATLVLILIIQQVKAAAGQQAGANGYVLVHRPGHGSAADPTAASLANATDHTHPNTSSTALPVVVAASTGAVTLTSPDPNPDRTSSPSTPSLGVNLHEAAAASSSPAQGPNPNSRSENQAQGQDQAGKEPWALPRRRPYIIAHRGASGDLPEHTLAGYKKAIEDGADFIECDVVLTRDLVPVCRHEPNLSNSTDALQKLPGRVTEYVIDGVRQRGVFSFDLTLEELSTLRALQPWPFRDQAFNGRWEIPTLEAFLGLAQAANRTVGVYVETKHPTFTNSLAQVRAANTSLEDILLGALSKAGYALGEQARLNTDGWLRAPAFLQSFEVSSLKRLGACCCLPLVLLLGEWEAGTAPDTGKALADMLRDDALDELSSWAAGVGPDKRLLAKWQRHPSSKQQQQQQQHLAGVVEGAGGGRALAQGEVELGLDHVVGAGLGSGSGAEQEPGRRDKGRFVSTGLLERLHSRGLQVHPWTFRDERQFILRQLSGNPQLEYALYLGPPAPHNVSMQAGGRNSSEGGPGPGGGDSRAGGPGHRVALDVGGLEEGHGSPAVGKGQHWGVLGVDGVFTDFTRTAAAFMARQAREGARWDLPVVNRLPRPGPCLLG